jgi:hypothetical protein
MLDLFHTPSSTLTDIKTFYGGTAALGVTWQTWLKPRGKTMANILLVGCGGNGGNGVVGANSTAAGGGGGGSGAQAMLTIPIHNLPDVLYLCLPDKGVGGTAVSYIGIAPTINVNQLVLTAKGGGNGGNGSGATAGGAGSAGVLTAIGDCPLAALGNYNFLVGQAGIIGGTTVSAGTLTLPTTGLIVTGGTGGGGLPAAAATGTNGGSFTVPVAPTIFYPHAGGQGSATATVPADLGRSGNECKISGLLYFYGGTGSASTHGTALTTGLVQGKGGNGGPGSGGGGSGGALTSSTAATGGLGGSGFAIITCW